MMISFNLPGKLYFHRDKLPSTGQPKIESLQASVESYVGALYSYDWTRP